MSNMSESWPPVPAGRTAWSQAARRRLAAILCAVLPPEEVGADPAKVPVFVGSFAGTLPALTRMGLRLLTELVFWLAPLLIILKPRAFDRLDIDDQERLLERIVYSGLYPLRLIGMSLKALAGLGIVGDPAARKFLGIDPARPPLPPVGGHVRWNEDIAGLGRESP